MLYRRTYLDSINPLGVVSEYMLSVSNVKVNNFYLDIYDILQNQDEVDFFMVECISVSDETMATRAVREVNKQALKSQDKAGLLILDADIAHARFKVAEDCLILVRVLNGVISKDVEEFLRRVTPSVVIPSKFSAPDSGVLYLVGHLSLQSNDKWDSLLMESTTRAASYYDEIMDNFPNGIASNLDTQQIESWKYFRAM